MARWPLPFQKRCEPIQRQIFLQEKCRPNIISMYSFTSQAPSYAESNMGNQTLSPPVKKLSSNFSTLWIWPKLLNAEQFPLRPLTLGVWPSSALPDTWAKAEAAKEKKYPGIRVLTVPFWAAESEWDESQKQGSGCPGNVSFCLTSWWPHQITPRLAPSGRTSSVLWFTSGLRRPSGLGATVCDLGPFPATDLCWR